MPIRAVVTDFHLPIVIIDFPPIEHHTHYKKPGVLLHISRCVTGEYHNHSSSFHEGF